MSQTVQVGQHLSALLTSLLVDERLRRGAKLQVVEKYDKVQQRRIKGRINGSWRMRCVGRLNPGRR